MGPCYVYTVYKGYVAGDPNPGPILRIPSVESAAIGSLLGFGDGGLGFGSVNFRIRV